MALRTDAAHTPSKSKSRSSDNGDLLVSPRPRLDPMLTTEGSEDEYLDEDDFEAFEESAGSKSVEKVKLPQSPITLPVDSHNDDDDDDDLDDALLADEDFEHNSPDVAGGTQGGDGLDVEGMTLEVYMQMYAKRAAKNKELADDLVTGDVVDASPEAVDPQGLDGCSPGPGQRHINGTESPFRLDVECFSPMGSPSPLRASAGQSPRAQHALATILAKVEDVQKELCAMTTPLKGTTSSPIMCVESEHKLAYAGTPAKKKNIGGEPSPEVKINILKRELKKTGDDLRKAQNTVETMKEEMMSLHQHIHSLEDSLHAEQERHSKAVKAKTRAVKAAERLKAEMEGYDELLGSVERLRLNEEGLLRRIEHLTLQNKDLSGQLKSSMSRELEW
ncbi:unnamed protein product, partial [Symbiodinium microadriaticum]